MEPLTSDREPILPHHLEGSPLTYDLKHPFSFPKIADEETHDPISLVDKEFVVLRFVGDDFIEVKAISPSESDDESSYASELTIRLSSLKKASRVFRDLFNFDFAESDKKDQIRIDVGIGESEPEKVKKLFEAFLISGTIPPDPDNMLILLDFSLRYDCESLFDTLQSIILQNPKAFDFKKLFFICERHGIKTLFGSYLLRLRLFTDMKVLGLLEDAMGINFEFLRGCITYDVGRESLAIKCASSRLEGGDSLDSIAELASILPVRLVIEDQLLDDLSLQIFSHPNLLKRLSFFELSLPTERDFELAIACGYKNLTLPLLHRLLDYFTRGNANEVEEVAMLIQLINKNIVSVQLVNNQPYVMIPRVLPDAIKNDKKQLADANKNIRTLGINFPLAAQVGSITTEAQLSEFLKRHPYIDTVCFRHITRRRSYRLPKQVKNVYLLNCPNAGKISGEGVDRVVVARSRMVELDFPRARYVSIETQCKLSKSLNLPEALAVELKDVEFPGGRISLPKVLRAGIKNVRGGELAMPQARLIRCDNSSNSLLIINPEQLSTPIEIKKIHPESIKNLSDPKVLQSQEPKLWTEYRRDQFMKLKLWQKVYHVARVLFRGAIALTAFAIATTTVLPATFYCLINSPSNRPGLKAGFKAIKDVWRLGRMLITGDPGK